MLFCSPANSAFSDRNQSFSLPEKEDLTIIYESYLTALIKTSLPKNSVWAAKIKLSKLILTLIAIFDEASFYISNGTSLSY